MPRLALRHPRSKPVAYMGMAVVIVGMAVVIASLGLVAAASAATSTVTIEPEFLGTGGFKGEVDSPNSNCIAERKVVVFRKRPGEDRKIGGDRSDDTGAWRIFYTLRDGRYYARVKRKEIGNRTCRGARSGTLAIDS